MGGSTNQEVYSRWRVKDKEEMKEMNCQAG